MNEVLIDDWMTLADEIQTSIIPFGQFQGGKFKLYEIYEYYFENLRENISIMKNPDNKFTKQFYLFLNHLESYIQQEVFNGKSNYDLYLQYVQQLFSKNVNSKILFEEQCKIYEQPNFSLYIKPKLEQKSTLQIIKPQNKIKVQQQIMSLQKLKQIQKQYVQMQSLNIVFVGHVDHGKSTLLGRILKQFDYSQSKNDNSLSLTSFTDIYDNQKQRGKTFQFSKYTIQLEKYKLNLFDTPGHKHYVSNMIMALRIADIIFLVVSAKKGQFESGFGGGLIKEVLMIGDVFQIKNLIIVVTKMQTIQWDQKQFKKIKKELQSYIKGNFCYQNIQFIAFDSIEAKNYDKKIFNQTRTLSQCLKSLPLPSRKYAQDLRLPIFDIQHIYGSKQLFGKIQSGFIYTQMPIKIYPNGNETQISSIIKDSRKIPYASAGQFVTFILKNQQQGIKRGNLICHKTQPLLTNEILCELECLHTLLISGFECIIHIHQITSQVKVQIITKEEKKKQIKANFLKKNDKGLVKILFAETISLEKNNLGKFVLRNGMTTIAFGKLLKIHKLF